MTDVTSPETRTKRLAFLDSFMSIGYMMGLPIGTFIKNNYGFVALFSTASMIILTAILYVIFVLKETVKKEEITPNVTPTVQCGEGKLTYICSLTLTLMGGAPSNFELHSSEIKLCFRSITI